MAGIDSYYSTKVQQFSEELTELLAYQRYIATLQEIISTTAAQLDRMLTDNDGKYAYRLWEESSLDLKVLAQGLQHWVDALPAYDPIRTGKFDFPIAELVYNAKQVSNGHRNHMEICHPPQPVAQEPDMDRPYPDADDIDTYEED